MERPTLEYIARLGSCWTPSKLTAARQNAALPDPPTWTAFLGPRMSDWTPADILLRVLVALQHVSLQRIALTDGESAGSAYKRCKAMDKPELLVFAQTLGVFLDTDPKPAQPAQPHGD